MKYLKEFELFLVETSATGGPVSGGMGAASANPSGLAGQNLGPNWASQGVTNGSGDIGVPMNPSGNNRVFQLVPMGRNHGAKTGKKSRVKKLDLKSLRSALAKRNEFEPKEKGKKVMNFNNFLKNDFTTVKK